MRCVLERTILESVARPDVPGVLVLSTDAFQDQVSPSLITLANQYKAEGYFIVTIAFDDAFTNSYTRDILRQVASSDGVVYGAPAYSQLNNNIAEQIVNLYVCPSDPGTTNTVFFNRDGLLEINGYTLIGTCPNPQSVDVELTITAQQQLALPLGTPITFYFNNPELFGATQISTYQIPCAIPAGTSETITINLPISSPAAIYAVLNDDGEQSPPISFPITNIEESIYINNIDNVLICTDPIPTLSATKYTTTPIPICDSIIIYNVDVCNVSTVDAVDVVITDIAPTGAILQTTNINYNGCSSGNGSYDIPAGCCISLTYIYNVSNVANGLYADQDVVLTGPNEQTYIDFDGASTVSEDIEITGNINCISDVVIFTKEANVTDVCEESFITFMFTIDNQTNVDIFGLDFTDNLPSPVIWAGEPYLMEGVSIGNTNINGIANANFTIDIVEANTTASFYIDAYLGDWTSSGFLTNTASLENWPSFVNGNGATLTATALSITINSLPEVDAVSFIQINSDEAAFLEATVEGADAVWVSDGDGYFCDSLVEDAMYIPGPNDVENGIVNFTISADTTSLICQGGVSSFVQLEIIKVYDFGDAPDVYNTTQSSNGPQHLLTFHNKERIYLGSEDIDSELDGQPAEIGEYAENDDDLENDDEESVDEFTDLYDDSIGVYLLRLEAKCELNNDAILYGWVDFNRNELFEAHELAFDTIPARSSVESYDLNFSLPTDLQAGLTYIRFRITTDTLFDDLNTPIDERSFGFASNGEVEDYSMEIYRSNTDEICNNGVDDDGDGLIDCQDGDCSSEQVVFIDTIYQTDCNPLNVGLSYDSLLSVGLCDSITVYNTTLIDGYLDTIYQTDCNPLNVGLSYDSLLSVGLCDSITVYNTTLVDGYLDTIYQTDCNPLNVGLSYDSLLSVGLCDSITVYNTTLVDGYLDTIYQTDCNPLNVGLSYDSLLSVGLCDSITVYNTTLVDGYMDTIYQTDCNPLNVGLSYDSLLSVGLCDSITVYNTTLVDGYLDTIYQTDCNPLNVGLSYDSLLSSDLCDSITVYNTTFIDGYMDTIYQTDCNPLNVGFTYDSLLTADLCDSVTVYSTTLIDGYMDTIYQTDCNPLNMGFTYDSLFSVGLCDSVTVYNTTLIDGYMDTIYQTDCNPLNVGFTYDSLLTADLCDSVTVYNTTLIDGYMDTIYQTDCNPLNVGFTYDSLLTADLCDSVTVYNTTLIDGYMDTIYQTDCNPLNVGFTYDSLLTADLCDSVTVYNTTLIDGYMDTIYQTDCNPLNVGFTYDSLLTADLCDSVTVYSTTLIDGYMDTIYQTDCNPLNMGFTYDSLFSVGLCDSITVYNTILVDGYADSNAIFICEGEFFELPSGEIVSSEGVFIDSLLNIYGCDSLLITNVQFANSNCTGDCTYFIPNSFSPNFDNLNDVFRILSEGITRLEIEIFDRWGNTVFQSDAVNFEWDGSYSQTSLSGDNFGYRVVMYCSSTDETTFKEGNITLIK